MALNRIRRSRLPHWRLAAYIFATIFVSVLLLAVNMGMVYLVFTSFQDQFPEIVVVYGGQAFLYTAPFMLLFLEWWLWDILSDQVRRRHQSASQGNA